MFLIFYFFLVSQAGKRLLNQFRSDVEQFQAIFDIGEICIMDDGC